MMGPRVTAGADRSAVSTALRTPKQNPAWFARITRAMGNRLRPFSMKSICFVEAYKHNMTIMLSVLFRLQ